MISKAFLKNFVACAMIFTLVHCHSKHEEQEEREKKIDVQELPEDFYLPSQVWNLIAPKGVSAEAAGGHGGGGGGGEGGHGGGGAPAADGKVPEVGSRSTPVIFSPVQIVLAEKNPGVLRWPKVIIQFPLGGGKLDFKEYLTGVIGTFYVRFVSGTGAEEKDPGEMEIYYWSQAKKRKVENDVYGSGCNKIIQLSQKKINDEDKLGLKVNTKDDRYLSVLAGHYFFVKRTGKEILVSQIQMTNSDLSMHMCDAVSIKKNSAKGDQNDASSEHE